MAPLARSSHPAMASGCTVESSKSNCLRAPRMPARASSRWANSRRWHSRFSMFIVGAARRGPGGQLSYASNDNDWQHAADLALAPGLSLRWPAMTFCFFFSCDVPAASSSLLDALYEASVVFSRLLFCSSYAIAFAVRLRIRVFAAPGGHGFFPRRTDAGEESLVQTSMGDWSFASSKANPRARFEATCPSSRPTRGDCCWRA